MTYLENSPRILLISQWPNMKNAEYELIEKVRQTGYRITVVDYLGFDIQTGVCLNTACLSQEYDFAISFHYDTPKLLNIKTLLWVANPLEFMHLRHDYVSAILPNIRSYDDYLFNGAEVLRMHIENISGNNYADTGHMMYASCSRSAIIPPVKSSEVDNETSRKLFYCGVNWERGLDKSGRAYGLLFGLQDKGIADFYGPRLLEGVAVWSDFSSYRGEIPFDGFSMGRMMHGYGAVLAVSSKAHLKSMTSSSRVFEGFAAGVPVISDENDHVKKLFGDLVYYFKGDDEEKKVASIIELMNEINNNPDVAYAKVIKAQQLIREKYCFEECFRAVLKDTYMPAPQVASSCISGMEVFLFHHDQGLKGTYEVKDNMNHVIDAARRVRLSLGISVSIRCYGIEVPESVNLPEGIILQKVDPDDIGNTHWENLRLGEKVALLSRLSKGDYVVFMTQHDFPHYDYFEKSLLWFLSKTDDSNARIHIGGFYVSDLSHPALEFTDPVFRNNISQGLYRWSQNSMAENEFGSIVFNRAALVLLSSSKIGRFDVVLPISVIADALTRGFEVYRSRHILSRVRYGAFRRHFDVYEKEYRKGFWAQHYNLVTNYIHELNAMYDIHHESPVASEIADLISGRFKQPTGMLIDPDSEQLLKDILESVKAVNKPFRKLKKSIIKRSILLGRREK